MTIETEPRQYDQLLSNIELSLICIVEYIPEVDTEVSVNVTWTSTKNLSHQNSRITYSYERLFHSINHALTINPLIFNDSDVYTCTANVLPSNDSMSTVYGSYSTTEELSVTVCKLRCLHIFITCIHCVLYLHL